MASSCLEMKDPSPQSSRREEGNWTDSREQVRVERDEVRLRIERRCRMRANTQGILFVERHLYEAANFLLLAGCAGVGHMVPSQFGCKFASGTVFGGAFGYWSFYCSQEFVHHGNSFKGKCFRILVAGAAPEPVPLQTTDSGQVATDSLPPVMIA